MAAHTMNFLPPASMRGRQNKSTVNEQIVEILIHNRIENSLSLAQVFLPVKTCYLFNPKRVTKSHLPGDQRQLGMSIKILANF